MRSLRRLLVAALAALCLSTTVLAGGSSQASYAAKLVKQTDTGAPSAPSMPITTSGRWMYEADGRTVVLRGYNLGGSSKVPDFKPFKDIYKLNIFRDTLGSNVARLLFNWEAYEGAAPGVYDESYLEYYAGVAQALWDRGMYVIVDFHSDGFSRYLANGCGSGAPRWAVSNATTPDTPINDKSCKGWGVNLTFNGDLKNKILSVVSAFYANKAGVRDAFLMTVGRVAQRMSKIPGVFAYEPLNEPWGDEVTEIAPLLVDAAKVIRKYQPKAVIYICASFNGVQNEVFSPKPKYPLDLHKTIGNIVWAPHYYDPTLFVFGDYVSIFPVTTTMHNIVIDVLQTWNDGAGVPISFGEFGGLGSFKDNTLIKRYYEYLDTDVASATQWTYTPDWNPTDLDHWNEEDFSIVDENNQPRNQLVDIRPQPRRFTGAPITFLYTPDKKTVNVTWTQNSATLGLTTELFLPSSLVSSSPNITVVTPTDGTAVDCTYWKKSQVVGCTAAKIGYVTMVLTWF
ncbi:glycoside hydrolase superfamily [Cladochytrium replicatum]|nr:glycoside hydrolase superfamily [Cladochytrium replicatum]